MLPDIQEKLATESFGVVGFGYGVSGQTIKNFLTRHGIDTAQYRKHTGGKAGVSKYFNNDGPTSEEQLKPPIDDDDWPEVVKPVRSLASEARTPSERDVVVAELLAAMPEACDRKNARITREDVPRILKLLERENMETVAKRLASAGATIDKLLKKYGIDYRTLPAAASETQSGSADLAVKPMMTFKTVAIKDSWGNDNELQVPEPLAIEKDPASGATVTKYPPGYAFGAGPQKNVKQGGY